MPLASAVKTQIANRLDAIFDAIEAGTAFTDPDSLTLSATFASGGRTYIICIRPDGDANYARISVLIKRKPVG